MENNELEKHKIIERQFVINDVQKKLKCLVIDGVTYAPVRVIAETLDCSVDYDDVTKTTTINRR